MRARGEELLALTLRDRCTFASDRFWCSAPLLWSVVGIVYAIAIGNALKKIGQHNTQLGDLRTFRDAAIALSHGRNLYSSGDGQYIYPPLIAFLYQPLGWISLQSAGMTVLIFNALASLLTIYLASAELARRFIGHATAVNIARIAALAALLTTDKIRAEFNMWETNTLMLLMFTLALTWVDRRPWLAGIALGFAFNIKYMPLAVIPYLLIRRRYRVVGGFAAAAIFFSIVPAISMGWTGNLTALASAYGGLAGLLHIKVPQAAHVLSMTDWRTMSATSGIARMTGWSDHHVLYASGILALGFVAGAAICYRRARLPLLRWRGASMQRLPLFHALFGVEFVTIIVLALVLSPFTNAAHLHLLLLANCAGIALLLSPYTRGHRALLIAGMAVMLFGITYPPGGDRYRVAEHFTKFIGLPAWCMLVFCGAFYATGLRAFGRFEWPTPIPPLPLPIPTAPTVAAA